MPRLTALLLLAITWSGCATVDNLQECQQACTKVFGSGGCLDGQAPAGSATACTGKCATLPAAEQDHTATCLNTTACDDPAILDCVDL